MSRKITMMLIAGLAVVAVLSPATADAAAHYFSQTKIETLTNQIHPFAPGQTVVYCPHGWHVTGGGFALKDSDQIINYSGPVVNGAHDQGWDAAADDTGNGDSGYVYQIFADCAN
jgi:hypothetical protein